MELSLQILADFFALDFFQFSRVNSHKCLNIPKVERFL